MKLSIKSILIGDKVHYRFPKPVRGVSDTISGTVKRKGRSYIEIANGDLIRMIINSHHLENIETIERTTLKKPA
jgi:hypothetical protein